MNPAFKRISGFAGVCGFLVGFVWALFQPGNMGIVVLTALLFGLAWFGLAILAGWIVTKWKGSGQEQ